MPLNKIRFNENLHPEGAMTTSPTDFTSSLTNFSDDMNSKPEIFHNDDIPEKYLEDHSSSRYVAPTSGLETAASNKPYPVHDAPKFLNVLSRTRYAFREYLAEFIGTLILVMFGDGVVAQVTLSRGEAGNYTTIAMTWATAVFLGYEASAGISGGHLNPAVTLSAVLFRGFPFKKLPGYIFSQFMGGFCGALIVYGTYYQSFNDFEGGWQRSVTGPTATGGIFCTFAQPFLSTQGQVTSEIVSTALLQFGIFSLTDPSNSPLGPSFPFGLWMLIFGIGSAFGYQTGYAINLARDFAPRIAASVVGYPSEMWTIYHHYFWVPLSCPFIGALLGAFLYDLLVYQGEDSPLNKADWGVRDFVQNITDWDLAPDFGNSKKARIEKVVAHEPV